MKKHYKVKIYLNHKIKQKDLKIFIIFCKNGKKIKKSNLIKMKNKKLLRY